MNAGQFISACCHEVYEMAREGHDPVELRLLVRAMELSMIQGLRDYRRN